MSHEIFNERLRLFVAITIPERVRNEIIAVQHELKSLALGDVRWTKPEQLHLTLKFLGSVPAASIAAVRIRCPKCAPESGRFICAHKASAFSRMNGSRAWFGLDSRATETFWLICKRASNGGSRRLWKNQGRRNSWRTRRWGGSRNTVGTRPKNSCRARGRWPIMSSANGGWRTPACSAANCRRTARGTAWLQFFRSVRN